MQNILEKVFSNLVVSAFLPAFTFVCITYFLFSGLFPTSFEQMAITIFKELWILLVALSLVLGFILFSLNDVIVQLYRGAFFPQWMNWLERFWAKRKWKLLCNYEDELKNNKNISDFSKANYEKKKSQLLMDFSTIFPPNLEDIRVTRLGNIFSALDYYTATRYGITSVEVWERLKHAIPSSNYEKILDSSNQLSLLLNFSLLSYFTAFISLIVALFFNLQPGLYPGCVSGAFNCKNYLFFYITCTFFLYLIGFTCYKISLPVAMIFISTKKAAFDLYRFTLLIQLKQIVPCNTEEEIDTWRTISDLIDHGREQYLTIPDQFPLRCDYDVKNEETNVHFDVNLQDKHKQAVSSDETQEIAKKMDAINLSISVKSFL